MTDRRAPRRAPTSAASRKAAPRRRVSRAQKQRILRRRRLGLIAAVLLIVLFSAVWQANTPVSARELRDFEWRGSLSFAERSQLNHLLRKYDITDPASLTMFFATAAAETDKGRLTLEEGGAAYYASHGYSADERGAGYLQLTHRAEHLAFLRAVGDRFDRPDTASYIAARYPWESACWEWSVGKTAPAPNPNGYAAAHGCTREVFLATQYAINGWRIDDDALAQIVDGAPYEVSADGTVLTFAGQRYPLPIGWPARVRAYEQACAVWCPDGSETS